MPVAAYSPQTEDRGTDWIDLAADQCTLFYTSEGVKIKRFDICTNKQLADFATLPAGPAFALRIRPNGDVLVAATTHAYRYNCSGNSQDCRGGIFPAATYTVPAVGNLPAADNLFALNLDPDNKTFWTGDIRNGTIARIDIATGTIVKRFNAGAFNLLAGLTVVGEITAATSAPPFTTSYYVETMESITLHNAGCKLALSQRAPGVVVGDKDDACKLALSPIIVGGDNQDSVVALLFKAPTPFKNGEYGISTGVDGGAPLSTVEKLVQSFIGGYYNALGTNKTLHVRVVIATSNGTTQCSGNAVKREHGQAWAHMVNNVADWVISQGNSGQVDIAGGSDMESSSDKFKEPAFCGAAGQLQWASAADTKEWVMGYDSEPLRRLLYDVGDAGGCPGNGKPPQTAAPVSCGNQDWTQEDVWYVSWGSPPSEPLPEIYRTDGNMSTQWANLSLYGFLAHGGSMIMAGSLTEFQDCACGNKPEAGWLELFNKLNGDPRTAQKTLSWSTDIKPLN